MLLRLSVSSTAQSAASSVVDTLADPQDQSYDAVRLNLNPVCCGLMQEQDRHATLKVQSVIRGHFGRCVFRARCITVTKELVDNDGDNINGGIGAAEDTTFAGSRASGDQINCYSAPALSGCV